MKKKSLVMLLCAALVITSAAFGTIAYLTDTAGVTNKFTVGNVDIKVDETDVNENGEPVDENGNVIDPDDPNGFIRKEEGNTYHLIPGKTYMKDPAVTVRAGSEESYVRMLVTLTHIDRIRTALGEGFMPGDHVQGYDDTVWQYIDAVPGQEINADGETVQTMTYQFRYHTTVSTMDPAEDLPLAPLFTFFTVPGELDSTGLEVIKDTEIRVIGQAIQRTGFENADDAWTAFDKQMNPETTDDTTPDDTQDLPEGDTAPDDTQDLPEGDTAPDDTQDQQEDAAAGE